MGLNNGISVRLDSEMRVRLQKIADRAGVKSSLLIRQAVVELLEHAEENGSITMPLSPSGKYPKHRRDGLVLNEKKKG